jgi:hypothetical protein
MALPKNYRKNLSILPKKFGKEQREALVDEIRDKGTYLPKGVMHEDMDAAFIDFVTNDLEIIIDGEKVPVIFLTLQRWAEFTRTWQFSGKHKNIKIPFITIVRKPDVQPGTNQQGLWNTAARLTYTYYQVPTWDGTRKGIDVYKVPQPTAVDMNYEVRLFCGKMRDLNKIQTKIHQAFRSRQFYISPNGHPMPIVLDSVGDESPINDFENRRFYVQLFEMRLQGYILDEDEYEVIPAKNRALLLYEEQEKFKDPYVKIKANKDTSLITYYLIFKPYSDTTFTTEAKFDIKFTEISNLISISSLVITVNDTVVTVPFVAAQGDEITFTITKPGQLEGRFTLKGNLL